MEYIKKCFQKNHSIVSKTIGDEVVLVPVIDNTCNLEKVHTIKGVGVRIWELLDGKRTAEEIKKTIVKEFKVQPKEAEKDLVVFLQELEKKNCISIFS